MTVRLTMQRRNGYGWIAGALALCFLPWCAAAGVPQGDALVEGAKMCTRYLARQERQNGIPQHLLSAIASTESGRWHNGLNIAVPWPWTINAQGQGYYFDNKEEAIRKVRELQAKGISSIDVGCMQVNLHHHPEAFASLDQAFDPKYNVAYAAQFLRQNFEEEGSWKKAAAAYHSRTPARGNEYLGLVHNSWKRIVNRLREARGLAAGEAASPQNALLDRAAVPTVNSALIANSGANPSGSAPAIALPQNTVAQNEARPGLRARMQAASHRKPSMRVIEVKQPDGALSSGVAASGASRAPVTQISQEQGVRVIRPAALSVAEAAPSAGKESRLPQTAGIPQAEARVVHLSHESLPSRSQAAAQKSGPRFIFD